MRRPDGKRRHGKGFPRDGGRTCAGEEVEDEVHRTDEIEMDDCAPGFGFDAKGFRCEEQLELLQNGALPTF